MLAAEAQLQRLERQGTPRTPAATSGVEEAAYGFLHGAEKGNLKKEPALTFQSRAGSAPWRG